MVALLPRDTLGLGGTLGRIDVEEGVDRRVGPVGDGDAVAGGPGFDLAQIVLDQRLAQIGSQPDPPPPPHPKAPLARARAGERQPFSLARRDQAWNEVAREKRTVTRDADDV